MANFEDGSYTSISGTSLLGKVLAGKCQMHYTRAAVGCGKIPDGETPKTMQNPADYVMDAMISAVSTPSNGECQVTVQINSSGVNTGFFVTCIVLYAEDPDEGEVPYTYLSMENNPEWIRPADSAIGKLAVFDLVTSVGEIDTVSADIDPNSVADVEQIVTAAINAHNTDQGAHENRRHVISQRIRDSGKPDYGLGGGGDVAAVLEVSDSNGTTEVGVVVSGTEYDANNMNTEEQAVNGSLVISELEE